MLERDILSSFKRMLDNVKGDHKISSEAAVIGYIPKRSKDIIAPSYEDAVKNSHHSNTSLDEVEPGSLVTAPSCCPPLSQTKEIRTEMTPDLFAKILKSTAKAKQVDPTEELILQGKEAEVYSPKCSFVTSRSIKQLKSSCPSMKTFQLQNFNLRAKQRSSRIRLVDFPSNIERVSVRGSVFEPKTFFSKMSDVSSKQKSHRLDKLRVLDVGRAVFFQGKTGAHAPPPEHLWPAIESLEELFLEGAPHLESPTFLETILRKFPNLRVLDLEGTSICDRDLLTIARHAPNLRELYLGYTSMEDASIIALENSRLSGGACLEKLEVICLCETAVTDLGLASLGRTCKSLRSITVKRSKVSEEAASSVKRMIPGLIVKRVENTHIYAVFRNQGCDHFILKHDPVGAHPTNTNMSHR